MITIYYYLLCGIKNKSPLGERKNYEKQGQTTCIDLIEKNVQRSLVV